MDIDLVYLWVDGSDPKWHAKRNAIMGKTDNNAPETCKGRYTDNDELRFSLRSVEMYAPWIRKIFIITDEQTPAWLDTSNPKVQIIDQASILPPQSLPCFNSNLIEHCLHRIPDLAEHFLYANDDMFLNRPVTAADFYAADGLPIMRFYRRRFRKLALMYREKFCHKTLEHYIQAIKNSAEAVERKYGRYYNSKPHHNIDAFLKSDYRDTAEKFSAEIASTMTNHLRSQNDIQRVIYSYAAIAKGKGHKQYATQSISFRLMIHNRERYSMLAVENPLFFCMNDSQNASDDDRRHATEFLSQRFPRKSQFEK